MNYMIENLPPDTDIPNGAELQYLNQQKMFIDDFQLDPNVDENMEKMIQREQLAQ